MSLIHANGFPANMAASRTPFFNAAWPRSKVPIQKISHSGIRTEGKYPEHLNPEQSSFCALLFVFASYKARSVKIKSRRNCLCFVVIKPTRIFKPTVGTLYNAHDICHHMSGIQEVSANACSPLASASENSGREAKETPAAWKS